MLGPLEVCDCDRSLQLGGPKQRTVLAHLLLRANHLVTVERLMDELWGDEPPASARYTPQTYIKHLRRIIGGERIEHLSSGYLLRIDPERVDLLRFEALVEDSRAMISTDVAAAARGLREALDLWRGAALDDLSEQPSLRPEIARLEESRIAAIEERIAAELALGRHRELVPELETLIGHHPYRERSWGHLMIALYRSGRQAFTSALPMSKPAHRSISVSTPSSFPEAASLRPSGGAAGVKESESRARSNSPGFLSDGSQRPTHPRARSTSPPGRRPDGRPIFTRPGRPCRVMNNSSTSTSWPLEAGSEVLVPYEYEAAA